MSTPFYTQLLNFRKMKHDFSPQIIREGKNLYEKGAVKSAIIVQFTDKVVKISAQVAGAYGNFYTCDVEIDRNESEMLDSNCDCPHHCDCLHLACLLFYLEDHFEKMVLTHFEGKKKTEVADGTKGGEVLKKVLKQAEKKANEKKEKERKKEDLQDYQCSAALLGRSSFFIPDEEFHKEQGDISFLFIPRGPAPFKQVELQISLRLPYRSKPITIQSPKQFFSALQGQEPFMIGSNRYVFGVDSFGKLNEEVLKTLRQHVAFQEGKDDKPAKMCTLDREGFGEILACAFEVALNTPQLQKAANADKESFSLPGIFWESFDAPLLFSLKQAELGFTLQHLTEPAPRLLLSPRIVLSQKNKLSVDETILLECSKPGVIVSGLYFRFPELIKRQHLLEVESIQKMAIPEQLFGSFIENSLPELMRYAQVDRDDVIDTIATIPCSSSVTARCDLDYAQGQLEANLYFNYGECNIPESSQQIDLDQINSFITPQGILARNLVQENIMVRDLFQGFIKDEKTGSFVATSEKRIVEFMTEVVPRNLNKVEFNCPETLQSRFAYDDTRFTLYLDQGSAFDRIEAKLTIEGGLKNASVDVLWDCVSSRKTYIAIAKKGAKTSHSSEDEGLARFHKILVLQLEPLAAILQVFDELQIKRLTDTTVDLPLWILVNLLPERFVGLPLQVKLSPLLSRIQSQIFDPNVDGKTVDLPAVPDTIRATLRHYQKDGVDWLSRLRCMGLNGILADDMGLGKTLQAIVAITQYFEQREQSDENLPGSCLIVCPTSLVDNWKEEFAQFQPKLNVTTVVGNPGDRKKILTDKNRHHVFITSYGLVQKDIDLYEKIPFGYLILDEAQHIKNRETRNARSVKKIAARHRLILTGTPLENSLEDLWSLFDFLMPGLLGSPDRFINSYIKPAPGLQSQLEVLRRKISPFVLRRMKKDVLEDLPAISHIVYHCHLSSSQQQLYSSYAKAATEQLTKLVEKEGFDKVRIHVLATLTRLKQICCHPAIFAKEQPEAGDSSKYEMLLDLVGGLIDSKHKTVIFSQYTRMLGILRDDLQKMGTKFSYLDGSSKNRLQIVKQFNEDESIPLFLVSLKAGGSGLNLVGADTVIHYDMWWNPAVENQATDRVWRLGQKQKVSSYKLITLGTIEEKILELQERKKELLKEIVNTDEEVISKLTWEEVLELLRM